MSRVLLACAVGIAGCGRSHGIVPGLDPDRPVITLTEDEWRTFCEWRETLRGDAPLEYWCDYPDGGPPVFECDGSEIPPCRTWDLAQCLRGLRSLPQLYPPTRTMCAATVDELAACWEARETMICFYNLPGESQACDQLLARCPGG